MFDCSIPHVAASSSSPTVVFRCSFFDVPASLHDLIREIIHKLLHCWLLLCDLENLGLDVRCILRENIRFIEEK